MVPMIATPTLEARTQKPHTDGILPLESDPSLPVGGGARGLRRGWICIIPLAEGAV